MAGFPGGGGGEEVEGYGFVVDSWVNPGVPAPFLKTPRNQKKERDF